MHAPVDGPRLQRVGNIIKFYLNVRIGPCRVEDRVSLHMKGPVHSVHENLNLYATVRGLQQGREDIPAAGAVPDIEGGEHDAFLRLMDH